jgi:ABC-type sugar transport system permease subunit
VAARTHSYAQPRRSNHRATLAVLFGFAAAIAIPLAIELTRKVSGAVLLDAVWAIPVAAVAAVAALVFERGASGSRLLRAARVLAITGICLTLSSALAVGIYEFLLWKEHHK